MSRCRLLLFLKARLSFSPLARPGNFFLRLKNTGTDLGGGCRGCAPPLRLRLSNTTDILQKKKTKHCVVNWCKTKTPYEVEQFILNA